MKSSEPIVMDGRAFARRRHATQVQRARAVTQQRGRAPAVAIVTFAPGGAPPRFLERKLRACSDAGVDARPVVLPPTASTGQVAHAVAQPPADVDGVFLEVPVPEGVDLDAVMIAIPEALDVDVMTPGAVRRYFAGQGPPAITPAAARALAEDHGVSVAGLRGIVVAEPSDYADMFREEFRRAGASVRLVHPDDARDALPDAELVIASAARAGLIRSDEIRRDAVVIDAGYFNPGGRGDVDLQGGVGHLRAIAPVPGAIGPATVSMLVERVIDFAERLTIHK